MTTKTHTLIEWSYHSAVAYRSAFDDIELDIHITTPTKETLVIPAFWAGEQTWKVRFIPTQLGVYEIDTICSDPSNISLHHLKKNLTVTEEAYNPYASPLALSKDKTFLIQNKKPYFWLSDTWWMALSSRLCFKNFTSLLNHRKKQGFNVIQLVAGLFPDMHDFDPRCENEGGLPWWHDENMHYTTINPDYFDQADRRISALAQEGFTLCIVGAWGYYLQTLGKKKMKQHWRYIIARWGVYPTIWCPAGEATMPFYLSSTRSQDSLYLKETWTDITRYIKSIDPFSHLVTIHPTEIGSEQLLDPSLLDINLLQASHHGYESIKNTITLLQKTSPTSTAPLIMDEVNYEGILHDTHDAVQRLTFWTSILFGSKGFGYGANGIWQANTQHTPFGESPHGATWGNTPWDEAIEFKGAKHISLAKQFLESLEWQALVPLQNALSPSPDIFDPFAPRIAGIDQTLRIVYFYGKLAPWDASYTLTHLIKKAAYRADFWNPRTGRYHTIGTISTDQEGRWEIPTLPTLEDWIVRLTYSHKHTPLGTKRNEISLIKIKNWLKKHLF